MSDLKIMAERIGLPREATAEQIVAKVHGLGDELKESKQREETLVNMLAEAQAQAKEGAAAKDQLKVAEGRNLIQKAIANQIIDKSDEEFWVAQYSKDDEAVKKYIESHKFRQVLSAQTSLQNVKTVTVDPAAELSVHVAEIMANNDKMSEAEAVQAAYRRVPGLFERITEARRVAVASKEGAR
jgi:hypothetical protein